MFKVSLHIFMELLAHHILSNYNSVEWKKAFSVLFFKNTTNKNKCFLKSQDIKFEP